MEDLLTALHSSRTLLLDGGMGSLMQQLGGLFDGDVHSFASSSSSPESLFLKTRYSRFGFTKLGLRR